MFSASSLCLHSFAQLLRGVLICLDDVDVPGAAAQVARNPVANFIIGRVAIRTQECVSGHQHSRSAEAALQTVLLEESLLQRMQLAVLFEALDRQYLAPVRLNGVRGAGFDGPPIHHDRAGPTVAGIAADVSPSEPQGFADKMDQEQPRLHLSRVLNSIDFYFDANFSHR